MDTRLSASPHPVADAVPRPVARARVTGEVVARVLLAVYAGALAVIAFWPVPVDSGVTGLLHALTLAVPWLTYGVIEFSANVLLFVPLGALCALVLAKRRILVLPIALAVTLVVEAGQWMLLAARTPTFIDVVANVIGAGIGLLVIVLVGLRRR